MSKKDEAARTLISMAVEDALGDGRTICDRCGATLDTYASLCSADLADPCPGFLAIEAVRGPAAQQVYGLSRASPNDPELKERKG